MEVVLAELPQSVASDPTHEALGMWDAGKGRSATARRPPCGAALAVLLRIRAAQC